MVTEDVIKEIYEKFDNPPKDPAELNLPYYIDKLKDYHPMRLDDGVIIVENVEEYSPLRRILVRRLTLVMEFTKCVAFAMPEHIFFFEKHGEGVHLHFCNSRKKPFWKRLLSKIFFRK